MKTKNFFLTLALLVSTVTFAQVGIGTDDPHPSAILEVDVTSLTEKKGFLPPRMSETERDDNITNNTTNPPAVGLTIYNIDANCVEFWGGYGWTSLCADVEPGDVLNSQTGKIWMDRNLGGQVATAFDDAASYGDLYQWGRAKDDHQLRTLDCTAGDCYDGGTNPLPADATASGAWDGRFIYNSPSTDWHQNSPDDTLWQGINGTNNPCPSGYRVPTEAEWQTEILTWDSTADRRVDAYNSKLKLPSAGFRGFVTGTVEGNDDNGRYWSSTIDGTDVKGFAINLGDAFTFSSTRNTGRSVRCIKGE